MTSTQNLLWPIHPKPIEGESLSSWLSRIAYGNALTLTQFRKLCLPSAPGQGTDIDQIDDLQFFEALANGTGVSVEEARQTGYVSDEGRIYSQSVYNNLEWIAPLTIQGHQARYESIPFCPSCLAEDEVPYYRKRWRYAFHPVCPKHGLLTNHCPSCNHPYGYVGQDAVGRAGLSSGLLGACRKCGDAFTHTTISGLDDQSLASVTEIQNRIVSALESGWAEIPSQGPIHVCLYLRGLHVLAAMALHPRRGEEIGQWICDQAGFSISEWNMFGGTASLESQPALVRARLLQFADWLTGAWPDRLVDMLQHFGLKASQVLPSADRRPEWLNHPAIVEVLSKTDSRSEAEIESARTALLRERQWPATEGDLAQFMVDGSIPPVRPLSMPVSPDLNDWFKEADAEGEAMHEARVRAARERRDRPRELYSAFGLVPGDVLGDLDDATEHLNELVRERRKKKSEPTSG